MPYRRAGFALTPPSLVIFVISLVLLSPFSFIMLMFPSRSSARHGYSTS